MIRDPEQVLIFAEQHYCKNCLVNPCEMFTNGNYEQCAPLIAEYDKQDSEHHAFLASVQKQHIPGKCVFCRNEEMDDRDKNYTLTTLRNNDGTIRMRGYLCSYHRAKEWV
jgi:hypothetical protein